MEFSAVYESINVDFRKVMERHARYVAELSQSKWDLKERVSLFIELN